MMDMPLTVNIAASQKNVLNFSLLVLLCMIVITLLKALVIVRVHHIVKVSIALTYPNRLPAS